MDKDFALLHEMRESGNVCLHFYQWEGLALTYGHFANPEQLLNLDFARSAGVSIGRRPTGGGLILHVSDFAFSLLIPASHQSFSLNTLKNYLFVNQLIAKAIYSATAGSLAPSLYEGGQAAQGDLRSFCMADPAPYDLVDETGKKICGGAQRKTRWGFLHQGSVSLTKPPFELVKGLVKDEEVVEAMCDRSYYFTPQLLGCSNLEEMRALMQAKIQQILLSVV